MLMQMENGVKLFGSNMIFMNVTVAIQSGDRIGLVGVNGAGKTTLLDVLMGLQPLDQGELSVKEHLSVGYLRQNSGVIGSNTIYDEMKSELSDLLQAEDRMKQLTIQMQGHSNPNDSAYKQLAEEYNRLQSFFETNGGYQTDSRIQTILNGMGFAGKDTSTLCQTLSGGEKTRLALAKLLLRQPELLILDEPTNHLDFASLRWLEDYLKGYQGAILTVSHDRYFLDRICNRIWHLNGALCDLYKGNYTKFTHTREQIIIRRQKEYEQEQQQIVKLTEYIAKNKVRASTAAMAKSSEKKLERLERTHVAHPKPPPIHRVRMGFHFEFDTFKNTLTVENLTIKAGGKPICTNGEFQLERGDKVALVGSNGVGKSTFLKALMGKHPVESGQITWGTNVKISYFEQEQSELHTSKTVLQELWDRCPSTYEQDIRRVLSNLLFREDDIHKPVDKLSGGERARLRFAIMMYEEGNVLLMDEPTNHLDTDTKDALDRALRNFEGTILMVSHDRYLLNQLSAKVVEMTPDGFVWYHGGYDAYEQQRQLAVAKAGLPQAVEQAEREEKPANPYHRSKKQRAQQVAKKQRLTELEQQISDTELAMALELKKLEEPEIAKDPEAIVTVFGESEKLRLKVNELMEEWAELSESIQQEQSEELA